MEAMMQTNGHGDTSVLTTLFAQNGWANLKLLEFCEQLNDEQLDATAIGCYGSIRNTLWHIVGAEVSYVHRVNGNLPPQPISRDVIPAFAVMKDVARWTNDELLQLALSTRRDTLVTESEGDLHVEYPLASLMMQAINHATEHRAQIAAIVTQLGMEPPDMSGWQYMGDTGEFREWKTGAGEA
jgi:uncharacterized damage-inducible protein DinB